MEMHGRAVRREVFDREEDDAGPCFQAEGVRSAHVDSSGDVIAKVCPCPRCEDGDIQAVRIDPDSMLTYPVRIVWECTECGHSEVREDGSI